MSSREDYFSLKILDVLPELVIFQQARVQISNYSLTKHLRKVAYFTM